MRKTWGMTRLLAIAWVVAACTGSTPTPEPAVTALPQAVEAPAPQVNEPAATQSGAVSRADYGDGWPLTVESGIVRCDLGRAIVFETPDGIVYALNGIASADPQYEELEPIWADDPTGLAPKLDIAPLIEAGLKLCP